MRRGTKLFFKLRSLPQTAVYVGFYVALARLAGLKPSSLQGVIESPVFSPVLRY